MSPKVTKNSIKVFTRNEIPIVSSVLTGLCLGVEFWVETRVSDPGPREKRDDERDFQRILRERGS